MANIDRKPQKSSAEQDLLDRVQGPLDIETQQRTWAIQRLAALGEMTGGIAHDFRNLLAVIESGLRLAERSAADPELVRNSIAAAREGIGRAFQLTSQLLAFAKHQELDAHPGYVNDYLRSFEPLLKYGAGPEIRLQIHLATDTPTCLVDPALFDAAILNLVTNARDAMPAGGVIEIVTERIVQPTSMTDPPGPGTYVRVRVKDNGPGMLPEVLRRVFDPLFTTKGENGTGMGLPQVYAFTRSIGGHISISSEHGLGTTVDLLFPSCESDR